MISVTDALDLLMHMFFVALGVLTIVDFLRHRDAVRRDVALLFCFLSLPFLIQLIAALNGQAVSEGANSIAIIGLVLEPYFLLRVARHLRSMPGYMLRLALYALIATIITGIVVGQRIPVLTLVVSQTYLIGLNLYAMVAFVRGALKATGVARQRLRYAAAGTGLFALIFVAVLLASVFPQQQILMFLAAEFLAIACASAFYVGFVPPRWLRRDWQLTELHQYLLEAAHSVPAEDTGVSESLKRLCRSASQAVGGLAAGVFQWDEATDTLELREDTDHNLLSSALANGRSVIETAAHGYMTAFIYVPEVKDESERKQLAAVGAGTWLLIPMTVNRSLWGMLIVFLPGRSLFIDDDLSVLELFAHENAIILTNYRLIAELRNYSGELEQKVTERTAALSESEQRYRNLNVELEQRVSDRTIQLETANKELEAFSYSVSHDLRAPLRAIDGFSRILVEDHGPRLPPDAQHYLDRVRSETLRMGHLIDDLLMFSQVNRQTLKKQTVDLTALVNDVLADLRAELKGRQIEVSMDDLASVQGDQALLRQVFVNLLSNAFKYTGKREQALIEIRRHTENSAVIYSIKDNGAGFDMRFVNKLFGVFQRLHSGSEFEGTGVGLAIVQRVINRHGGRIWAEAEVDKGATFFFTLGEIQEPAPAALVPQSES